MLLKDIVETLQGTVLTGAYDESMPISSGGAADLMSDVLAFTTDGNSLLLSGLTNPQVVRTAEMAGVAAIVFVRGKSPPAATVALADELNIPLVFSAFGMYEACGLLYRAGLPGNPLVTYPGP